MIRVLMVGLLATLVVGSLVGVIASGVRSAPTNKEQRIAETVVELSEEENGATRVDYKVRDGEVLVLRILNRSEHDCLFRVFSGPKQGDRTVEAGLAVDYRVVPAGSAEATRRRMSEPCQEIWVSRDR